MLVVAAVLAAIGIMALIATLAKNAEQASIWQSVIAVVLGLLGGTFFPISQAPGVLSKLTFARPAGVVPARARRPARRRPLGGVDARARDARVRRGGGRLAVTRLRRMAEV